MSTDKVVCNGNGVANGNNHSNGYSTAPKPTAANITSNGSSNDLLRQEEVDPCPMQVGYKWNIFKCVILYPLATLPLGVGLLLAYWFPHVWIRLTCSKCSLPDATYVIVKDLDRKYRVECVHSVKLPSSGVGVLEEAPVVEDSDVEETVLLMPQTKTMKYFEHRHLRYVYREELGKFLLLANYDSGYSCSAIHDLSHGLTSTEYKDKLIHHGANSIDVPVKSYHVLFIEEVLHPFYIFQIIATIFWMCDHYFLYAGVVFFISTLSVLISLFQTRRHRKQLHDMVISSSRVTVYRDGKEHKNIVSEDIVPGDVLVIPAKGMSMPCDAALLSGHAIVNEAMLTGESVPVTKTPLPQDTATYSPDRHKRHTLFCGTQVIQTRFYANTPVTAVVIRTGFSTSKGGMVRSILFPKPLNIKFYADAIKFVLVLSLIALGGFIYTITILQVKHYEVKETILRAFDLITTVVPPALPAALTVGTVYALNRLRKQKIYCISPQRVNLCGKVKLVCFDKTGTLTEDSLDMYGVRPSSGDMFAPFVTDPCCLTPGPLVYGMATCHSLTTIDGVLTGDPLDLKMFKSTKWLLEEPGEDSSRFDSVVPTIVRPPPSSNDLFDTDEPLELGILRQFTFSSEIQRMSVLVRALPTKDPKLLHAYVKGAPETIKKLCLPQTIPKDFLEVLTSLTQQGYRVLALGHKTMHLPWHKAERVQRDVVERDLSFAGLIVMQNRLKPETSPVIQTLLKANIRTVMVTGDNMLTAVSVARECGMIPSQNRAIVIKATFASSVGRPHLTFHPIGETANQIELLRSNSVSEPLGSDQEEPLHFSYQDNLDAPLRGRPYHLVVEGKSFTVINEHCPEVMERLLVKGTVFARMSPDQKAQLVTALMDIGYGVAMCGDGANDCGALKAAHAGISLSETEASVASPFTSKEANINCVPTVIREGRAALVTSFSAFKYMALYSIAEFISTAILYTYESNLSDFEYLYIDLVLVLSFAFVMGFTGPYPRLVRQRPPGTLAGIHVLLSMIVQILLLLAFQLGALFYLRAQAWYTPLVPLADDYNLKSSENAAIFQISIYQYIGVVVALSTAAPFRKSFLTNYWFVLCLLVLFPVNLYLTLAPSSWWPWFWAVTQFKQHPDIYFKIGLVLLALNHCVLAYFLEGYIFPSEWMRKLLRIVRCKRRPTNRYKHIKASIPPHWPPLTSTDCFIN